MAPHAISGVKDGLSAFPKVDCLMASIPTGNQTAAAADAFAPQELGIHDGVPLQLLCIFYRIQTQSHQLLNTLQALLIEISQQAVQKIVNDSVAVLHDCGSDLNAARTQQQEFQSILPRLYAAHAADVHSL